MVPSSFCISGISSSPAVRWCRAVAPAWDKAAPKPRTGCCPAVGTDCCCSGGSGPRDPAPCLSITWAREGSMQARLHISPLPLKPALLKITKGFAVDLHRLYNEFGWGHSVFAALHPYRRKLKVNHLCRMKGQILLSLTQGLTPRSPKHGNC